MEGAIPTIELTLMIFPERCCLMKEPKEKPRGGRGFRSERSRFLGEWDRPAKSNNTAIPAVPASRSPRGYLRSSITVGNKGSKVWTLRTSSEGYVRMNKEHHYGCRGITPRRRCVAWS